MCIFAGMHVPSQGFPGPFDSAAANNDPMQQGHANEVQDVLFNWALAENQGLMQDPHRRLRVSSACGMMWSQRNRGKFWLQVHGLVMKWFLKVWDAFWCTRI